MNKFYNIMGKHGLKFKTAAKEPDWNVLFNFGLPINFPDKKERKYEYNIVVKNILLAADFLMENRHNINYLRHYDSFKALLLALKIHYPSKFEKIEKDCFVDFSKSFDLNNIQGRHIKLRNICVYRLSSYFLHNSEYH